MSKQIGKLLALANNKNMGIRVSKCLSLYLSYNSKNLFKKMFSKKLFCDRKSQRYNIFARNELNCYKNEKFKNKLDSFKTVDEIVYNNKTLPSFFIRNNLMQIIFYL
jgi:hypothetical protein